MANSEESTYCDEYQIQMTNQFSSLSYVGLLSAIKQAERARAPNRNASRITTNINPGWERSALFLLLQLNQEVLRAAMNDTLPSRAMSDLKPFVRDLNRQMARSTDAGDPVIYANWLADRLGRGLSIGDYSTFIAAMESSVGLTTGDGYKFNNQGRDLVAGINLIHAGASGSRAKLIPTGELGELKTTMAEFVKYNRNVVLNKARQRNDTEIMVRAEVGWSICGHRRAGEHNKLTQLSPAIFRIAYCVLQHLFPTRGFRMHQYVLFEITREDEAAIGESIASHLAGSYLKYGGFNVSQAGITVGKVWSASINWKSVALCALNADYFKNFEQNMKRWKENQATRIAEVKVGSFAVTPHWL